MTEFYPRMTFHVRRRQNEHRLPAQTLIQTQPTSAPLPTAAKYNRVDRTHAYRADKGKPSLDARAGQPRTQLSSRMRSSMRFACSLGATPYSA